MAKRSNPFYAQVGRTDADSFRITVRARDSKDQYNRYRELAVSVYKLAAEMERRAQKLAVGWVISPQVFNSRIDVELSEGDDERSAASFIARVLGDLGLT
ncbi:MAG TPA: hypothetical protein VMP38_06305 [Candidatus Acidoferrum sp.]|nr:hypothetical protein [Candidatus Acidoferrum sp.]